MYISLNLWLQFTICSHRFESVPTDSNLFPQIRVCGHRLQFVPTDSNLWPQIAICYHRFEYVAQINWICGHRLQSVRIPQIQICSHRFKSTPTDSNLCPQISLNLWPQAQNIFKYIFFPDVPLKAPYNLPQNQLAHPTHIYANSSQPTCPILYQLAPRICQLTAINSPNIDVSSP